MTNVVSTKEMQERIDYWEQYIQANPCTEEEEEGDESNE
jgi:hypothetical protein